MRIACVIQRYGTEIIGGGETFVRYLAEHLNDKISIDVITTTAGDYQTWSPLFTPGVSILNGITVRRFPVSQPCDQNKLTLKEERVYYSTHTTEEEIEWAVQKGPYSPELIRFLRDYQEDYNLILFFTFRYFHSYAGISTTSSKAVLIPFAEDEPSLYLNITKSLFSLVQGIIFVTPEEEQLVRSALEVTRFPYPTKVISIGVDIPESSPKQTVFKKPYILYLGRIDPSKGCHELFSYYIRLRDTNPDTPDLLLAGSKAMNIPRHSGITYLGHLSEEQKNEVLRNAVFLIMPSPYESLSLVTLEAMAHKTPVLVNASCKVLLGHCIRSNGGLWYDSYDLFARATMFLTKNPGTRDLLGEQGYHYVKSNYCWDTIISNYCEFLRIVCKKNESNNETRI